MKARNFSLLYWLDGLAEVFRDLPGRSIINRRIWRKRRIYFSVLLSVFIFTACAGENKPALKIGDRAPEFSVQSIGGETVSSSSMRGGPVILRFFLPDCRYCRADTKVFNEYYGRYKQKGLEIIYVNTTPKPSRVHDFVRDLKIDFPVVLDPEKKLAAAFRVKAFPQAIVLDPDHKIIGAVLGGVSKEELDAMLGPFLQGDDR